MATIYGGAYGGDQRAQFNSTNPLEEERRRRNEQQAPAAQQSPYQAGPQGYMGALAGQSKAPAAQMPQAAQAMQRTDQTFAQLQQQGQARPAPPPPAQPAQMTPMQGGRSSFVAPGDPMQAQQASQQAMSLGFDPVAAMANPQQFERYLTQMQQREAAMPGSTMMAASSGGAPMGGAMTGRQNAQGYDYAELMSGPPRAASSATGGNQFTGDIGAFLSQQLNGVGANAPALPTAYDPSTGALNTRAQQLGNMTLPDAPVYTPDARLMEQAQQLTGGGTRAGAAGVSASGVDPMAAMTASRASSAATPALSGAPNTIMSPSGGQPLAVNFNELRQRGYQVVQNPDGKVNVFAPGAELMQDAAGVTGQNALGSGRVQSDAMSGSYNADGSRWAPPGMQWSPDGATLQPAGKTPAAPPAGDQYGLDRGNWFRDAAQAAGVPQLSAGQRQNLEQQNTTLQNALLNAAGQSNMLGGVQGVATALDNFSKVNTPDTFTDPVTGGVTTDATRANIRQNAFLSSLLAGASPEEAQAAAMQASGVPAGLGAAGGGQGGGGQGNSNVSRMTNQTLEDALRNPSAFDNAAVQQLYNRMGQDIDDQYAQQQTAMREEMAARGLSDSSIMGGRLADLNVGQRQARTELANQLGIQRAQDFANARNQAIGMGMQAGQNALQAELGRGNLALEGELGRGNLDVNRQRAALEGELGRGNLGLNQQRAAVDAELGRGNLSLQSELGRGNLGLAGQRLGLDAQGQQFGQTMQGMQFQNLLGQQNFQNQMSTADFGLRRSGQEFNQGLQGAQFQNSLGQQGFQNRMSLADFQRGLGNDAFSQRMGLTDRLTNYGQQAFDNDMRRNEFNRLTQSDQDNLMLRYFFGMGG